MIKAAASKENYISIQFYVKHEAMQQLEIKILYIHVSRLHFYLIFFHWICIA